MRVVDRNNYEEYASEIGLDPAWERRDFVSEVEAYFGSILSKVLIVSGLRGTGKSMGVLQAIKDKDAVYILMEKGEQTAAEEVRGLLFSREEKIIILDEYTWVKNREVLDAALYTLVGRGKHVVITGTESLSLEALQAGALIHRAIVLRTTHMSFGEYRRLWHKSMDQRACDEFLTKGGIFDNYVIENGYTMDAYITEAIVENLTGYARDYRALFDKTMTANIVYTLLYRAICDLMHRKPKLLEDSMASRDMLKRMGIDLDGTEVDRCDLRVVADMLCSAGVLVKVPNILSWKGYDYYGEYRTYIVNPSLTYQFIRTVFPGYENMSTVLGWVYEASCMVDLYYKKCNTDGIYYAESRGAENCELDIVIAGDDDRLKKQFYLIECKHQSKLNVWGKSWSIVSGRIDQELLGIFPDSEVRGRFIAHPGDTDLQRHESGREVAIVNQDENLYKYYNWGSKSSVF